MSNPWQTPGREYAFKIQTVATFISAIAYGLVISLYVLCCQALFKGHRKYSTRKKWFFLSYATIMLSLSTLIIVTDMKFVMDRVFKVYPNPTLILAKAYVYCEIPFMVLPFTLWGADFLMMWRCAGLYQRISKVFKWISYSVVVLVGLVSLGSGLIFLGGRLDPRSSLIVLISISFIINVTLSALIALRIRHHQQYIRQTLGTVHGPLYTRITVMCVESCGLIAACILVTLILLKLPTTGFQIPLSLLPHMCVISPLLIVYRVAKGTEVTTTINVSEVVGDGINRIGEDVHFASEVSLRTGQGV